MIPVTRKEQYLNRLTGEEQAIPEAPVTRTEQYLARLCGMETEIPSSPITREELYLAYLNGEDVTLPEPITRLEQFMAYAASKSETKPTPLTREEFYWDKYHGGAVLKDFPGLPASIVTVTDAVAKPLDSLKVAITPVQAGSGDPSPDNIRPISGWTGANITVDPNVTPILPVLESAKYYSKYFNVSTFTAKPNSEYYVRSNAPYLDNNITTFIVCAYEDTPLTSAYGVFGTEIHITTKTSGKISVYWRSNGGGSAITITNIDDFKDGTYYLQITDHPTDGYMGEKYQITFTDGTDPLTVYGGTLDVTNGTLTVTHRMVDLGTKTWTTAGSGRHNVTVSQLTGIKIVGNSDIVKALSSQYKACDGNGLAAKDMSFAMLNNTSLQINDSTLNGSTAEDFKAAMNGVQLCYELATPITYQLTPTEVQMLLGTNNLWADTGDILEGKYWGKKSSATRAMLNTMRDAGEITPTEEPEENDER